jgi:hypothetical protein
MGCDQVEGSMNSRMANGMDVLEDLVAEGNENERAEKACGNITKKREVG